MKNSVSDYENKLFFIHSIMNESQIKNPFTAKELISLVNCRRFRRFYRRTAWLERGNKNISSIEEFYDKIKKQINERASESAMSE